MVRVTLASVVQRARIALLGLAVCAVACRRPPKPQPAPTVVAPGPLQPRLFAGGGSTCFLTAEQRVKCWGRGDVGQLGDGLRGSHG